MNFLAVCSKGEGEANKLKTWLIKEKCLGTANF
jgi:hypothetical protein